MELADVSKGFALWAIGITRFLSEAGNAKSNSGDASLCSSTPPCSSSSSDSSRTVNMFGLLEAEPTMT